jgi:hypothetical protein
MRALIRVLPALVLAAAVAGCGGEKRVAVSGKVTVGGKPLTGGSIRFVSVADPNRSGGGQIKADGTYEVPDAPVGECKVTIDNSHLDPAANKTSGLPGMMGKGGAGPGMKGMPAGPGMATGPKEADKAKMGTGPKEADVASDMNAGKAEHAAEKFIKLDPSFAKVESTPLTFTVEKGPNTKDFDIK